MTDTAPDDPADQRVRRRRRSQRPQRSLQPVRRAGYAAAALLALGGFSLALALQPYSPWVPLVACAVLGGLSARWPPVGIAAALALLPLIDLTAWTGMLFATESDLAVLAVVVGIAGRFAVRPPPPSPVLAPSGTYLLLSGFLVLSYAISSGGAFVSPTSLDAALAGFASPFNGLRLAKGIVLGLLLLACVRGSASLDPVPALRAIQTGLVLGTVGVALAAMWEREAFVSLTDFAADYRTTALFWEMHVGGAQLDGWLALAMPFTLWALLRNRDPLLAVGLAIANALILFCALTTFSRGLFAALALQVVLLVFQAFGREGGQSDRGDQVRPLVAVLALVALLGYSAFQTFGVGGYRGLLALIAAAGLSFAAAPLLAPLTAVTALAIGVAGFLAGTGAGLLATEVPKAVYVLYGVLWLAGAASTWATHRRPASVGLRALTGLVVVMPAAVAPHVTAFWSGTPVSADAWLAALLALSPLLLCRLRRPRFWEPSLPAIAVAAIGLIGLAAVAAIGQSYFASARFATVAGDLAGRGSHWARGLSLLQTPSDWLVGVGTGRYAETYYWKSRDPDLPGNFSLQSGTDGNRLLLSPAGRPLGWGELFRVVQRISPAVIGPMQLRVRARVAELDEKSAVSLHAEVCRQWLLYHSECLVGQTRLKAGEHEYDMTLPGSLGPQKVLGLSRPTQFAMALESTGQIAEILSVQLTDASGEPVLKDGHFEQGMAWWFFESERLHLPYHAKNLWLHALIEQGVVGLLAVSLFGGIAVLWVATGPGRSHPLAPACLAALLGFGIVGAFDSLIDAPRLGLLFALTGGLALSLRGRPPQAPG